MLYSGLSVTKRTGLDTYLVGHFQSHLFTLVANVGGVLNTVDVITGAAPMFRVTRGGELVVFGCFLVQSSVTVNAGFTT